ncbi:PatA/PatG family cyanobactin maturation protease [Teichococcus oryzae]|uniref:PatA/PatG family cyanobactin maturation protease n=1 Tax=Teichococcus oryzae TaxID=1608942 RepID=A0A5B2TBG8_9PROT|nr:PatA/PatG family cyanobactin maturation protease [Pseudoroseomonas oryzae]KAA2211414.1 PatA/PatG family cyanobactin maturation protease [Pseudoroseomonas oryzae]
MHSASLTNAGEWLSIVPGIERIWSLTNGEADIKIAILDGPVDSTVISSNKLAPAGAIHHGTLVASVLAGSLGGEVVGIAPGCTIIPIEIFRDAKDGVTACTQDALAQAIFKATSSGANIINISAAQQGDSLEVSASLSGAITDALRQDVFVVAAAGNHGCACDVIPASMPGVLAVGAHDGEGVPLPMSNWGPSLRSGGLLAPGFNIPGACVGGGLCKATGTSFASALVAGVAGLLMSADMRRGVRPSGRRIKQVLLDSCDRCLPEAEELCGKFLAGTLNVARAADVLLNSLELSFRSEEPMSSTTTPPAQEEIYSRKNEELLQRNRELGLCTTEQRSHVVATTGLLPADCGCGGKNSSKCSCDSKPTKPQLVYAIGRLGISFTTQARRDSVWRTVNGNRQGDLKSLTDEALLGLFRERPFEAQAVAWTLSRTEVPMYVIMPSGPFAADTYKWLVDEWGDKDVELVSIPGVIAGRISLYDGMNVDVIVPDLRGMYSWENTRYTDQLIKSRQALMPDLKEDQARQEINRFLGKIFFRLRNMGLSPGDRALNAAATNAFNISDVIVEAGREGLTLRDVSVERSPLSRPGSDYYDVLVTFFDPRRRIETAPLLARFTIDVSDTVPVMIGEPVSWYEY